MPYVELKEGVFQIKWGLVFMKGMDIGVEFVEEVNLKSI